MCGQQQVRRERQLIRGGASRAVVSIAALMLLPPAVHGQECRVPAAIATLALWADQVWLSLLDRDGAYQGRLAEEGTFQRLNPGMDHEYGLDVRSSLFDPGEDARWAEQPNGLRVAGASISNAHILNVVDWRQEIHVSGPVDLVARYRRERSLTARRDYPWVGVRWKGVLGTPWTAQVGLGVHFFKPSADVEVALARSWRDGEDRSWTLEVRLAALDAFSDAIFQGLGVRADDVDAHYDYAGAPLAARTTLAAASLASGAHVGDGPLRSGVHSERPHDPEGRGVTLASGAARGIEPKKRGAGDLSGQPDPAWLALLDRDAGYRAPWLTRRIDRLITKRATGSGRAGPAPFTQLEQVAFLGALLQVTPLDRVTLALYGTWARADTERRAGARRARLAPEDFASHCASRRRLWASAHGPA